MYIGNSAQNQSFTPQFAYFSGNASTTAFTLPVPVASVAQVTVVVANVIQNPSSAYTVSNNTITFTSAPPTGTNNVWVMYTSLINQLIAPSPGTVGTSQLVNGTVVTAIDATLHGLTVGLGGGSVSTNTAVGVTALAVNTGNWNTGLGYQALNANTTGSGNTGIGGTALSSNTMGSQNVAVGSATVGNAPLGANTIGSYNTAIGNNALALNTTASYNTAVGYQAGYTNQLGGANTFIGNAAGFTFAYGSAVNTFNTFIGNGSGSTVTTGIKNTILGSYSGNQSALDIRTKSNYTVLSDGDGSVNVVYQSNLGNTNVGPTTVSYTIPAGMGGKVHLTATQSGVGTSYTEVPFIKTSGGTLVLGTPVIVVATANPLGTISVGSNNFSVVVTYANTYVFAFIEMYPTL
jgi:hypothetical protein